ncbi:hypothetical protein ACH5RR_024290 [Cinchona calisaya]|uniref:GDSL esterase/lipase 5 n=1 Tax=Cinchona calisaya TaxID=153742 RepID=A0ABD2YWA1_9GENT
MQNNKSMMVVKKSAAMANPFSSFQFLYTMLLLLVIQAPASECRKAQKRGGAAALFIFGDSYFDAGNNNYINTTTLDQANFWPYGETYFNFPTGRFSNGRLISDFIAEYAKVPLIAPFLQPGNQEYMMTNGVNFASAGAGALDETFQGEVINLNKQLLYYTKVEAWLRHKLGNVESKRVLSRAVYLFSIGTNDYISPFLITNSTIMLASSSRSRSQYVDMVIGNLTTVVKAIYERGGRKFGFLNLGDLGCLPGLRILQSKTKGGCLEEASTLATLHNRALHKILTEMKDQLQGFKYSLYDFNSALRHRMTHPSRFGFEEGRAACCGAGEFKGIYSCGGKRPVIMKDFELCEDPQKYVFWDSYHLTERVYRQMAAEMWSRSWIEGSYNLKALLQN